MRSNPPNLILSKSHTLPNALWLARTFAALLNACTCRGPLVPTQDDCPDRSGPYVLARRVRSPGAVSDDIPSDQFVTLDGIRFHYPDWGGDGDPLLLLAGLGCTAHVFAVLAPHLTERFRVLALTRRGHGLTDQV